MRHIQYIKLSTTAAAAAVLVGSVDPEVNLGEVAQKLDLSHEGCAVQVESFLFSQVHQFRGNGPTEVVVRPQRQPGEIGEATYLGWHRTGQKESVDVKPLQTRHPSNLRGNRSSKVIPPHPQLLEFS